VKQGKASAFAQAARKPAKEKIIGVGISIGEGGNSLQCIHNVFPASKLLIGCVNVESIGSEHTEQSISTQDDVCYFSARSNKTGIYQPAGNSGRSALISRGTRHEPVVLAELLAI
jgi:hypothetical protein